MRVAKSAAKQRGKKVVNETLDDKGVVGGVVAKYIATGPLDAAEDTLDTTEKDIDKKVEQTKTNMKE